MRALAAALVLLATPAAADWQFTRWGMKTGEVIAGSGGKASFRDGRNEAGVYPDAGLEMPFDSSGIRFKAEFFFDKSVRLERVELVPNDYKECSDVMSKLTKNYGKPSQITKNDMKMSVSTDWMKSDGKDVVRYVTWDHAFGANCAVHYFEYKFVPKPAGPEL